MSKKTYKLSDKASLTVGEPAVAYRKMKSANVVDWNPNFPVHATQEEWWEHIHEIERGPFYPVEETFLRIKQWLDNYNNKILSKNLRHNTLIIPNVATSQPKAECTATLSSTLI
jgi:hypothetical protein